MISVRLPGSDDRDRLRSWRNRDAVRAVSLDQDPVPAEEHEAWFERLQQYRQGQLGIVCHDQRPVGVVQLTQLDVPKSQATWGCHLGEVDVPPGFGATLPILGIALGLRGWGLTLLDAEVIETNKNMLGIHRRLAIRRTKPTGSAGEQAGAAGPATIRFQVSDGEFSAILERAERLFPSALSESLTSAVVALDSWRDR